jgi:hypothetical protein
MECFSPFPNPEARRSVGRPRKAGPPPHRPQEIASGNNKKHLGWARFLHLRWLVSRVSSCKETPAAAQGVRVVCLTTLIVVLAAHGVHQCDLPDLRSASARTSSLSAPKAPCLACTVTTATPLVGFEVGKVLPNAERARAETAPGLPAALSVFQLGVRAPPQL